VFDSHDANAEINEPVAVDARPVSNLGAIRYSEEVADLPDMMSFGVDQHRAPGVGRRCGVRVAETANIARSVDRHGRQQLAAAVHDLEKLTARPFAL